MSKENIAKAKLEIADGMTQERIYVPKEEHLLKTTKNKITVSLDDIKSDFYLESIGNRVSIYSRGKKYAEAEFAFAEEHLKKCLLFACAIAIDVGISTSALENGISQISSYNIRQKVFCVGDYMFFDDSYNASLESIIACFESAKNIETTGKKSLILGDVLELGDFSEAIHYQLGKSIPTDLFNNVFLIGNFAKHIARGAVENGFSIQKIHINQDPERPDITAQQIKEYCSAGELRTVSTFLNASIISAVGGSES